MSNDVLKIFNITPQSLSFETLNEWGPEQLIDEISKSSGVMQNLRSEPIGALLTVPAFSTREDSINYFTKATSIGLFNSRFRKLLTLLQRNKRLIPAITDISSNCNFQSNEVDFIKNQKCKELTGTIGTNEIPSKERPACFNLNTSNLSNDPPAWWYLGKDGVVPKKMEEYRDRLKNFLKYSSELHLIDPYFDLGAKRDKSYQKFFLLLDEMGTHDRKIDLIIHVSPSKLSNLKKNGRGDRILEREYIMDMKSYFRKYSFQKRLSGIRQIVLLSWEKIDHERHLISNFGGVNLGLGPQERKSKQDEPTYTTFNPMPLKGSTKILDFYNGPNRRAKGWKITYSQKFRFNLYRYSSPSPMNPWTTSFVVP